ncbi:ribosome biogenesis protein Nop16 [Podospora didyma]|uniref:Nucleolar protein 16 n=1 Tax=Podospora didyma TaxID=330526 RepID=A0AAE0KL34_9PEZI|nr:ribosome biogenesis protein Nop16 [Podospora didyma]
MGRELQKRKNRSSRSTVRMPNRRKKALNPLGSSIVAQNWNKKETPSQNYSRFGIVAKLGTTAGGSGNKIKKTKTSANNTTKPVDPNAVDSLSVRSGDRGMLQVSEVRVERDASGKITRVIRTPNPLHDPLNDVGMATTTTSSSKDADAMDDGEEWDGIDDDENRPMVVRELERQANQPVEKPVRHVSERELEWLQRLVARHGDDTAAMARDPKLNPMQQTRVDIAKRLKKAGLASA